uniref:Ovule protein n=2 Tax=Heterorhabditis bacteriophora TaxID=37862 RepID=A0A1I7WXK2_HETBA
MGGNVDLLLFNPPYRLYHVLSVMSTLQDLTCKESATVGTFEDFTYVSLYSVSLMHRMYSSHSWFLLLMLTLSSSCMAS